MEEIDQNFKDFPPVKMLISKYSVSATIIVSLYLLLAFLLSLSQSLGWIVVLLTGLLYPGYQSILNLSSSNQEEFNQWVSFWIIFSFHNFLDYLFAGLIGKIPFYYSTRLFITIYLFWPTTKGSLAVYKILNDKLGLDKIENQPEKSQERLSSKSKKED